MKIICGSSLDEDGKFLAGWYIQNTGLYLNSPFVIIGFVRDNTLKGVATFTEYNESSIDMHAFMPNCLTRQTIQFILDYVFNQLKCNILTVKPPRSNKKLLRIMHKLNPKSYLVTIPMYYGPNKSDDCVLHVLTKDWALNWIRLNEKPTSAESSRPRSYSTSTNAI